MTMPSVAEVLGPPGPFSEVMVSRLEKYLFTNNMAIRTSSKLVLVSRHPDFPSYHGIKKINLSNRH